MVILWCPQRAQDSGRLFVLAFGIVAQTLRYVWVRGTWALGLELSNLQLQEAFLNEARIYP
jgi:hypothetical protein